ncbi:DENN domain-containing protein 1A isoform X2 [Anabrus simplex]|uniref:DENN domain-containing protein 1A isoform X2 n=1 Tax=Anabrus simplex TaxID=316456 RepID=UPI0035A26538
MGSRLREKIKHIFQCFCEVVNPQPGGKDAWIIQKFPDSYKDEEVLKSVPKFAYPCEFANTVVQHFSFVLTSIDSKWTFGFCRHDPKTETALVLLSYLPWHDTFYKLLNQIAEITHSPKAEELWMFLEAVYNINVPDPGGTLIVPYSGGKSTFVCQCPNQFQLPSIPENRNLTEYYSAVDVQNMMTVFASMLYERRIIFTSKKLSRLSACVQSANAIIYPMNWQHIFIPVLPIALIDYLLAPMPYLIGVPEPVLQRVRKPDLGEVVILDADNNTVESPFQDVESLPAEVVSSLRRQFRNRAELLGDGVSRAFLRALVLLIGGYRDALRFQQGQKITFNPDAFIESRPASMQPFLRKMLHLQIFQQFIEERLEMLNNGLGFSDEFEMEACNYSGKSSSKLKQQYKEWTYTMRKEGSAFIKTVKNKANPAMKSAVKSVKERGKDVRTAYKGIRSKFRDMQPPRDGFSPHEKIDVFDERDDKPQSAPPSPTHKVRPQTVISTKANLKATASYRKEPLRPRRSATGDTRTKQYSPLSPSSEPTSPEAVGGSTTPGLQLSPMDMDLMGDLQDIIFRNCSTLPDKDDDPSPPVDRTQNESETDLIRLDSTPSDEDFDPLLTKDRPTVTPNSSHTSSPSSSTNLNMEGLTNPLYPYFIPTVGQKSSVHSSSASPGNKSFLYSQVREPSVVTSRNRSATTNFIGSTQSGKVGYSGDIHVPSSSSSTPCSNQDMDLLKEYGIDFNKLSTQNGGPSSMRSTAQQSPVDPFEDLVTDASSRSSQMKWTKFD